MRLFLVAVSFALALAAGNRSEAQPPGRPQGGVTAEQVRSSIRGGVKYLLKEQNKLRGTWDDIGQYPGGVTALCTLALLNSGVEPSNPQIQKSLAFLRTIKPSKTYSVALQTMAFCAAEPGRDLLLIQRNVD